MEHWKFCGLSLYFRLWVGIISDTELGIDRERMIVCSSAITKVNLPQGLRICSTRNCESKKTRRLTKFYAKSARREAIEL